MTKDAGRRVLDISMGRRLIALSIKLGGIFLPVAGLLFLMLNGGEKIRLLHSKGK